MSNNPNQKHIWPTDVATAGGLLAQGRCPRCGQQAIKRESSSDSPTVRVFLNCEACQWHSNFQSDAAARVFEDPAGLRVITQAMVAEFVLLRTLARGSVEHARALRHAISSGATIEPGGLLLSAKVTDKAGQPTWGLLEQVLDPRSLEKVRSAVVRQRKMELSVDVTPAPSPPILLPPI